MFYEHVHFARSAAVACSPRHNQPMCCRTCMYMYHMASAIASHPCYVGLLQALVLRYGEVRQLDVLTALAGAATSALGPHWLGLQDINGHLGLDKLMKEAAAATDSNGSGRQKVELNLGQLGLLAGSQQDQ